MAEQGRQDAGRRVVRVVFTALLLDLMAFTMPLPLFPRIMEDFVRQEANNPTGSPTLLMRTMSFVRTLRSALFASASSSSGTRMNSADSRWDLTLLGGLLASLFSFCQFLVSPHIGHLSDRYGRRPVLLASMVGNLVSAALWLVADRFEVYALSRVVGGLSEGNVQLSIACISDVTPPETRARSLALVGAAFSLAFTVGPSLGAYLSQRTFGTGSLVQLGAYQLRLNAYAVPAAMTLVLLAFETAYLWACLPETRGWKRRSLDDKPTSPSAPTSTGAEPAHSDGGSSSAPARRPHRQSTTSHRLASLSTTHLLFLFCFSGAEFTLCFLTHALFHFSNAANGRLLGFIGLLSAALSGGYVRRLKGTASGSVRLAQTGMRACALALALLAGLPYLAGAAPVETGTGMQAGVGLRPRVGVAARVVLWTAAALLAFVSASVVTSLSALAASASAATDTAAETTTSAKTETEEEVEGGDASGAQLGTFRSRGQLGRALGPIVFTAVYWTAGPSVAYALGAVGVAAVATRLDRVRKEEEEEEERVRSGYKVD